MNVENLPTGPEGTQNFSNDNWTFQINLINKRDDWCPTLIYITFGFIDFFNMVVLTCLLQYLCHGL